MPALIFGKLAPIIPFAKTRLVNNKMKILILLIAFVFCLPAATADVAPRISDREIIEVLAETRAEMPALDITLSQDSVPIFRTLVTTIPIISVLFAIFMIGYMIWGHFFLVHPILARLDRIHIYLTIRRSLGQSPEDIKLIRTMHALHVLAKDNKKVETALRRFSLL